jgi:hypothetical protein
MGMTVIDKSLSGHCGLKGTCAKDLKVSTVWFSVQPALFSLGFELVVT